MCAAFEVQGKVFRPGKPISANGRDGVFLVGWAGFARSELRSWWLKNGLWEVDVPAERFAERSDRDGKLRWGIVPEGLVLRGLCEMRGESLQLRILTRAATEAEEVEFEHGRMPVLEAPLFTVREVLRPSGEGEMLLPGFE